MLLLLFIQISLNVRLSAYLSPNIRHRPLSHLSIVTFPSNRRAGWGVPNSWRTWSVHRAMPHARHRTSGPRRVARPPLHEIARADDVAMGEARPCGTCPRRGAHGAPEDTRTRSVYGSGRAMGPVTRRLRDCAVLADLRETQELRREMREFSCCWSGCSLNPF